MKRTDIINIINSIVKKAFDSNLYGSAGNCGSFAVAASIFLKKKGYNPNYYILAPEGEYERWDHVALIVEDILFDCNGITTPGKINKEYSNPGEELFGMCQYNITDEKILDGTDYSISHEEFLLAFENQ